MFDLKLTQEEIVIRISARKLLSNKEVMFNIVGNLLTRAGGDLIYGLIIWGFKVYDIKRSNNRYWRKIW